MPGREKLSPETRLPQGLAPIGVRWPPPRVVSRRCLPVADPSLRLAPDPQLHQAVRPQVEVVHPQVGPEVAPTGGAPAFARRASEGRYRGRVGRTRARYAAANRSKDLRLRLPASRAHRNPRGDGVDVSPVSPVMSLMILRAGCRTGDDVS